MASLFSSWRQTRKGANGKLEEGSKVNDFCHGIWSEEDQKNLQKHLVDYLEAEPSRYPFQILHFDPYMRALLCANSEEVYEKYSSYLINLSVGNGLLFAGLASTATHPYDIVSLDENVRVYGEIFNICSLIVVVLFLCNTVILCIETCVLVSEQTDILAIYRQILRFGKIGGICNLGFVCGLNLACVMVFSLPQLIKNGSRLASLIGFLIPIIIYFCLIFVYYLSLMPSGGDMISWDYSQLLLPLAYYLKKTWKRDLKVKKKVLLENSKKKGILKVLKKDTVFTESIKLESQEDEKEKEENIKLLKDVLSDSSNSELNLCEIASSLIQNGLTRKRLKEASLKLDSFQLIKLLTTVHPKMTYGEALALVTYFVDQ